MNKALIVIDMQNDYFPGGKMALQGIEEALQNTNDLIRFSRKQGYKIFFVQHTALGKEATFFVPGTPGVELYKELNIQEDTIIHKHYPNSFRETDLKEILDSEDIRDLIICGAMTHMCIDTTVRAGFDLGYDITLAHDACATKDLQFGETTISAHEVHYSFVSAMGSAFCDVKSTEEVV